MSLNIKNERTHALVRELATLRGVNQTDAVTEAVERRIAELRQVERKKETILRLAREFRQYAGDVDLSTDDLYDEETGLPR
ncbi:MAG: type II toxin-antitoxin system VapB family antitoxin [Pseudolysinimonas sp.]|uniref:type II toxin-antitoxin system VapB family antitoxin n=1 Tax=Pseudolysinimonas sp. TaxID=2680009 RepID=UPI003C792EFD